MELLRLFVNLVAEYSISRGFDFQRVREVLRDFDFQGSALVFNGLDWVFSVAQLSWNPDLSGRFFGAFGFSNVLVFLRSVGFQVRVGSVGYTGAIFRG